MLRYAAIVGLVIGLGCARSEFAGSTGRRAQSETPPGSDKPGSQNGNPGANPSGNPSGLPGPSANAIPGNAADPNSMGNQADNGNNPNAPIVPEGSESSHPNLGDTSAQDQGGLGNGDDLANAGALGYSEDEMTLRPQTCNGQNLAVINIGGKCPAHFALYTMDDMSNGDQVPLSYVCCALPTHDVLSKDPAKQYMTRNRRCGPNEIMTGTADTNGNIFCSEINTGRYAMQDARLICAGDEGLFGIGGKTCGGSAEVVVPDTLPPNLKNLVIGPLGEDGCISMPFGSLVVQQGGSRCEDSDAMTLIEKATGAAVPMFP